MHNLKKKGDPDAFDENWKSREETYYNHFTEGEPKNQIQLAFQSHFEVFNEILSKYPTIGKSFLETGCGRGTLSNYFAKNHWDVTLLDYNDSVLKVAKKIFRAQNLKVKIKQGNALHLDFPDNSYDIVANIGLLEHFEDIQKLMDEQFRILKPCGWCFSYVVPERHDNIQRYFRWINILLNFLTFSWILNKKKEKPEVYRSDNFSERYLNCLEMNKVSKVITHGMYPLPMISHSPEFPFSLLPKPIELLLTIVFKITLKIRKKIFGRHGWICNEKFGQAFLVAFQKK